MTAPPRSLGPDQGERLPADSPITARRPVELHDVVPLHPRLEHHMATGGRRPPPARQAPLPPIRRDRPDRGGILIPLIGGVIERGDDPTATGAGHMNDRHHTGHRHRPRRRVRSPRGRSKAICVCTVQRMYCPTDRAADQRERHLLPRIWHGSPVTPTKLAQLPFSLARDIVERRREDLRRIAGLGGCTFTPVFGYR